MILLLEIQQETMARNAHPNVAGIHLAQDYSPGMIYTIKKSRDGYYFPGLGEDFDHAWCKEIPTP